MHLTLMFPLALWVGLPLALALIAVVAWRQRNGFQNRGHAAILTGLRGVALLLVVLLIASPMYVESQEDLPKRSVVVVLVDRSQSMALEDRGESRLSDAVGFLREQVAPALQQLNLKPLAMTFADNAVTVTGPELAKAVADGRRTNLGRAILQAVSETDPPPRAIVVLTDGAANQDADNQRAITALVENRVPVLAVGVGSEAGPKTVTLRYVEAPPSAAPKQQFRVTASLESGGQGNLPALSLVLTRDGQFVAERTIAPAPAGRNWLESFEVAEDEPGIYRYSIHCAEPADGSVRLLDGTAGAMVRVADEKELRVLFVQGALTWDYKFIRMALLGDPAIRLTGLSRTSTSSVFYQNVEDADELKDGFPTRIEQLAPFSVVVLANLRHSDLTQPQQEVLARFCGEFGGGVLMIGGPETFDASWRDSRLEQLLAVRFAAVGGMPPESPFALRLSSAALANPVFRISDAEEPAAAWARLPPFNNYARIDSIKPGAEIWAVHPQDTLGDSPRVLMAAQRFGSGRSAVIAVQNFWRWRLARDSDTRAFDRFWQQLLRHLAEGGREQLTIVLADQALEPHSELRLDVLRQADPREPDSPPRGYTVVVTNDQNQEVSRQTLEIAAGRSSQATFRTGEPGGYNLEVQDAQGVPLATRTLEIRDTNLEWQRPARTMSQLEQWAAVSNGAAVTIESCDNPRQWLQESIERSDEATRTLPRQEPAGINGWMLMAIAGCLGGEWLLRKRWGLT